MGHIFHIYLYPRQLKEMSILKKLKIEMSDQINAEKDLEIQTKNI